jgi:hypothetical protein
LFIFSASRRVRLSLTVFLKDEKSLSTVVLNAYTAYKSCTIENKIENFNFCWN